MPLNQMDKNTVCVFFKELHNRRSIIIMILDGRLSFSAFSADGRELSDVILIHLDNETPMVWGGHFLPTVGESSIEK